MLRSVPMTLCQVIEHNDAARSVVEALGDLGLAQFKDMNPDLAPYKRTFSDEARRCDDLKRRLLFLAEELNAAAVDPRAEPPAALPPLHEIDPKIRSVQKELVTLKAQEQAVRQMLNATKEHLYVLTMGSHFFNGSLSSAPTSRTPLVAEDGMLQVLAGVVSRARVMPLTRAIYRATRANCVVRDLPIDEPLLDVGESRGELILAPKNFFMVIFSGNVLKTKISKIVSHFAASTYAYNDTLDARQSAEARLRMEMLDLRQVVDASRQQRHSMLKSLAQDFNVWRHAVRRELATLQILNMIQYDVRRKVFLAQLWVPTDSVGQLRMALDDIATRAGTTTKAILSVVETRESPPTYLKTNKFTQGFQGLVNTYGVPRYQEMNPGAFAVILFPFLFAIMFGDVGHGSLLLLLALFFIINEEKLSRTKLDDIVGMAFGGRYVLLLNAIFAIYVGFIYNEAFSVPLGLFKSAYSIEKGEVAWDGSVYTFGVDPIWHKSTNKMTFFNSYKMKISIVFGVAQMTLGICLSCFNHLHFKDKRSVWFGFVPELTFFLCIFGYLVILILMKWAINWAEYGQSPPSLLNVLISMFMSPGTYTEPGRVFEGQEHVQLVLLLVAVAAVPCLLLPKPILIYLDQKRAARLEAEGNPYHAMELHAADEAGGSGGGGGGGGGHEEEDFSEVVVHQVIHTIEFVLGSISNTASYLRLWALSLAHSQLSELFWDKVMREQAFPAAKYPFPLNGIVLFAMFAVWFSLNLGVLMVMENLSSFLHALRLQWVEFQNKFYVGDGYRFVPFSYAQLDALEQESE
ncbi:hypothetical protein AB1Y20_016542 [Prymnesium parvum]|uniref:V-type proton ATPase subunit a n=1 Tax=Prymnesium parvum TaxID=97485 RepID=A0AB34IE26_PRYPA